MLDQKFKQHLQQLLEAEWPDRVKQAQLALTLVSNDLAKRGMLGWGGAPNEYKKVIANELAARGNLIQLTISRVISALGVPASETLANDLKQEAYAQLTRDAINLKPILDKAWGAIVKPENRSHAELELGNDIATIKGKLDAELDLYVAALETRARTPAAGTVHITAETIGAVQTASGAIANVIQHIQPADQQRLIEVLERVLQDVKAAPDILPDAKQEIAVMAEETKAELKNAKPVLAKVRGMLLGIGTTIQTLGSVRDAYSLLKTAAAVVGVSLP